MLNWKPRNGWILGFMPTMCDGATSKPCGACGGESRLCFEVVQYEFELGGYSFRKPIREWSWKCGSCTSELFGSKEVSEFKRCVSAARLEAAYFLGVF